MKNRKFKQLNKKLLTASILSTALFSQPQAAPLPNGTLLGIDQGMGSSTNYPCRGSCFGMEIAPGLVIWTDFGPGTDGGIIVGKNQGSGGQDVAPSATNDTPCELSNAWNFFANYGCFTIPDASQNIYDDAPCAGLSCIGKTELNSFEVAWNGVSVPIGGVCSSPSCTADQLAGIFVEEWTITPEGNGPWSIRFSNAVPDGDPSSFGNVRFSLMLKGYIGHWDPPPLTPSPSPTPISTPAPIPKTSLSIELSSLDGNNGFRLSGGSSFLGTSVSEAGDINGDGLGDLIIGAWETSYVVFGSTQNFPANVDISSLDGTNGFMINGEGGISGWSSSAAGDINGDGIDDLIIGAIRANNETGASYVVFGSTRGFAAQLELSSLDGSNGFKLYGEAFGNYTGNSVSAAGDINGDGLDDLIIGAPKAAPNGDRSGASYVVFGSTQGFAAQFELSSLDGTNGFKLNGESGSDWSGSSVSAAGDINGDGLDDIIIGADSTYPTGSIYVVFGQTQGFAAQFELSSLDGANGFKLNGEGGFFGHTVSGAGDINGDGLDDLIIGAPFLDPIDSPNGNASGASYVMFGSTQGFAALLSLSYLDGSNGFKLKGEAIDDHSGDSVSAAGDINGDGLDDIIVGAPGPSRSGTSGGPGSSYVVFGSTQGFAAQLELSTLDGSNGLRLNGEESDDQSGRSVSAGGDINGDGIDDLIVAAPRANTDGISFFGASYVVFGSTQIVPTPTPSPTPTPTPTTCEALYPQTEVTMIGKGKTLAIEKTMTTTFKGHIVSTDEAKGKVTICRGSIVRYEVVSTVGTAKCTVKHGVSAESTGTLTDKGKLVCTNKPDGKDTDKFKIKRSKKKDTSEGRRWFR